MIESNIIGFDTLFASLSWLVFSLVFKRKTTSINRVAIQLLFFLGMSNSLGLFPGLLTEAFPLGFWTWVIFTASIPTCFQNTTRQTFFLCYLECRVVLTLVMHVNSITCTLVNIGHAAFSRQGFLINRRFLIPDLIHLDLRKERWCSETGTNLNAIGLYCN